MPTIDPLSWRDRDPAELDALFADRQDAWWNTFYADRARPVPFFVTSPDESLAAWVDDGVIVLGRALDLGCGHGRNAIYLARRGFQVDAVDYSRTAIEWGRQCAREAGVPVRFHLASVFEMALAPASFELVYDGGCFHHMPPHRRSDFITLVEQTLKPGGQFAMACFRPEGGSGFSDDEVYERGTLGGGLGYTEAQLRALWSPAFEIVDLRQMSEEPADSAVFGKGFLWVMLARRR